jgi:2-polyprenyl-3-methyl-5-hydroxy-6-metoxy-1,4-benzoquinol methylase
MVKGKSSVETVSGSQDIDFRGLAISRAEGRSSDVIYGLVFKIIDAFDLKGRALDFGAGRGNLTRSLLASRRFISICGADALPRPEDLPPDVGWIQGDLNHSLRAESFDVIFSVEVVEHLENPRAVFRSFFDLLKPGGALVLTTPNQESLRSYAALMGGGHFALFLGASYPAHITALLRLDFVRICEETGFSEPMFFYTDVGGIPKAPHIYWQRILGRVARGRLFSDNVALVATRLA